MADVDICVKMISLSVRTKVRGRSMPADEVLPSFSAFFRNSFVISESHFPSISNMPMISRSRTFRPAPMCIYKCVYLLIVPAYFFFCGSSAPRSYRALHVAVQIDWIYSINQTRPRTSQDVHRTGRLIPSGSGLEDPVGCLAHSGFIRTVSTVQNP